MSWKNGGSVDMEEHTNAHRVMKCSLQLLHVTLLESTPVKHQTSGIEKGQYSSCQDYIKMKTFHV